jgi:phosphoglycolate phosphatase-like HAD superfamily hydrolase
VTFSLLIFDLDGTLVPTMEDYADQAARLMEQAFATPFAQARAAYFRTSGLPFEKQLRELYPDRDDTAAVAQRFEAWKDDYLQQVALPESAERLIRGWREAGYRIAISSNNLEPYVERLARDWPVDCALGYRPADGYGKGEDHFRTLEERFALPRSRFLFTGDSPNDARIAAACGVAFRALLTDAFAADDFEAAAPGTIVLRQLDALGASLANSTR